MNYLNHYIRLINRAKNRILDCYTERHHIIPKCIGGLDNLENLVELTPEEHFVAHQLLIKIYPENSNLIHAAVMMTVGNKRHGRSKNKLYGWLRRRHSESIKNSQLGEKNSQFGKCWIYNPREKISKSIYRYDLEKYTNLGWKIGRVSKKENFRVCCVCRKDYIGNNKTCSKHCFKKWCTVLQKDKDPFLGRETEFIELYRKYNSINKSLKEMGFPGNQSIYGKKARKILADIVQ